MKPYVLVILCALLTNVYMTVFNSSLMYYVTYNMGLAETQASLMFTAMNIVSIVFIPFVTKGVEIFSKSKVYVGCAIFSGSIMILTMFTGTEWIRSNFSYAGRKCTEYDKNNVYYSSGGMFIWSWCSYGSDSVKR